MTEIAHDMSKVAAELTRAGKYKDLVVALRRAASTASAHQDLQGAVECLQLLRRLTTTDDWNEPFDMNEMGILIGSLFDNAIILYARATETKPIGRQKWFGIEKVPSERRQTHKAVMLIRDKELAHFGSGMPVDGTPMLEEALVLVNHGFATSLGFRTNRSRNRGQFAADFRALAEHVAAVAKESAMARLDEALVIINPLLKTDRELRLLVGQYPLAENLRRGAHDGSDLGRGSEAQTYAETIAVKIPDAEPLKA